MKIVLVLFASLTFALGGLPKDRYDPCAFFGICNDGKPTKATTKVPTTKAPPTKAPITKAPVTSSPDFAKVKLELVKKISFSRHSKHIPRPL